MISLNLPTEAEYWAAGLNVGELIDALKVFDPTLKVATFNDGREGHVLAVTEDCGRVYL